MIGWFQILILGLIQGAAELLPVSSSAHVIAAQKLMGLDPSSPEMTFLLVMLHTGTMFAVLIYFRPRWKAMVSQYKELAVATVVTGIIGFGLKGIIEKILFLNGEPPEVEQLFKKLPLIALALAASGVVILVADRKEKKIPQKTPMTVRRSLWIGAIQGLCLPFRGFSRSGATISAAMMLGVSRISAEEFSFALAVILTPPVLMKTVHRLSEASAVQPMIWPGLFGMLASFSAGLLALKWLSAWLERGRWKYFGYYCFAASAGMFLLSLGQ